MACPPQKTVRLWRLCAQQGIGRATSGRVAEWPVTDPILPVLVRLQDNAMAKSIARVGRENREDAGRSEESSGGNPAVAVRPAALAEPDVERYTIRLPPQGISGVGGVSQ
jgi:hypothetical protein